ncbi:MAG: CRISPR-associated endonuclease Cas2 [Thermoanaerobaculia bacterium]
MEIRSYIVTYDISSPKRWRKVFRTMNGFGEHIQLSVFRCELTALQRAILQAQLDAIIHHHEDQVLLIDLGRTGPRVIEGIEVLGRPQLMQLPRARVV